MLLLKTHQLVISNRKTLAHHASTVLPLKNGHVLVAWFGGSQEGNKDVSIWLAEKDEKGFSEAVCIALGMEPHWNPVLFQAADGRILLFFKVGSPISDWRTYLTESFDLGKTWSVPQELIRGDTSGGRGPVRNKPIRLKIGRVVAPASVERGLWRCFMDYSDDDCHTWKRSNLIEAEGTAHLENGLLFWHRKMAEAQKRNVPFDWKQVPAEYIHGRGIIQPTLWEDQEGVHALLRSGEGRIYRTDSPDQAETWCEAYPTEMPNNNSGIDLTRLDNGILLLVCNPIGQNFGSRSPISVFMSRDHAKNWEKLCDLEAEPGEFSYPAIVSENNHIWITYTYKRENIAYWEFDWIDDP